MDPARRIVIIGGGIIGSAIAAFLGERQAGRDVTVVERDPTYRRASSALSTGSIRQQFSTPINIALSQAGIAFLRTVAGEIGLVEPGYLYLASDAGRGVLARQHAVQRRCGAPVALLSPRELTRRFPWLDTTGLALGSLGLSGEGGSTAMACCNCSGGAPSPPVPAMSLTRRSGSKLRALGLRRCDLPPAIRCPVMSSSTPPGPGPPRWPPGPASICR
jgi:hypothetical protein